MNLAKARSKKARSTQGEFASRRNELNSAILELRRLKKNQTLKNESMQVFVSTSSVIVRMQPAIQSLTKRAVVARPAKTGDVLNANNQNKNPTSVVHKTERSRDATYFEQMNKLINRAANDNKKAVDTLKNTPSEEALAFYGMLSKR